MEKDRMRENMAEIDLYEYLRVIWRWRWMIIIGVIVAVFASIPASYLTRSYESRGILRLSEELKAEEAAATARNEQAKTIGTLSPSAQAGEEIIVTLPDYKIYSAAFTDSRSFLRYLDGQKMLSAEQRAYINKKLRGEPSLDGYIKPLYAYAEQEIKTFRPQEQFISAVQLRWKGPSSELARSIVDALGLFIKDAVEEKVMEGYVTQGYRDSYTTVQELQTRSADLRFSLRQTEKKLAELRQIAQRFPETGQPAGREVVSVGEGGDRYLSPLTQMVAAQVEIADTRLAIGEAERMTKINQIKWEIFTKLKDALQAGGEGGLFDRLTGIKDRFFQGKDLKRDEILIVRNEISVDFSRFEHRFHDVLQFISGPTLPKKATPSKRVVVVLTFCLGLFFFIVVAFFLEFIQRSQQRESNAKKKGATNRR